MTRTWDPLIKSQLRYNRSSLQDQRQVRPIVCAPIYLFSTHKITHAVSDLVSGNTIRCFLNNCESRALVITDDPLPVGPAHKRAVDVPGLSPENFALSDYRAGRLSERVPKLEGMSDDMQSAPTLFLLMAQYSGQTVVPLGGVDKIIDA